MASFGRVDAYVSDDLLSHMAARACLIDAFAQGWRIGRGRPLSRQALADARISDNFIDRLADLAKSLNWDAKRFLAALETRQDERAKGFRADKIELVSAYLAEQGYLDPADPLEKPQLHARVLAGANSSLRTGQIDPAGAHDLFERLWALATA